MRVLDFRIATVYYYRKSMGSATTPGPGSRPHRKPNRVMTSLRIERGVLDEFKTVAAANHRTVSDQLRWLIDRNLAEHQDEQRNSYSTASAGIAVEVAA